MGHLHLDDLVHVLLHHALLGLCAATAELPPVLLLLWGQLLVALLSGRAPHDPLRDLGRGRPPAASGARVRAGEAGCML
jgi:hypothetical protein